MNREILFRAKRIDDGEWVEGFIIIDGTTGKYFIFPKDNFTCESDVIGEEGLLHLLTFEVDPSTICQYTGLKDCNGSRIFEGDILESSFSTYSNRYIVYDEFKASFGWLSTDFIRTQGKAREITNYNMSSHTIIGNIFDNPELLEVQG